MKVYLYFALILVIFSCQSQETKIPVGPDKSPGSWMYNQRAYPNGIDKEAKALAELQYRRMTDVKNGTFNKKWQQVGPVNVGGRITDIALHPTDKNIIIAGSSVGGIWRSVDKGFNWELVFDEPGGLSIGNLTIANSEPNTIYAGTGEANGSATSGAFFGNGIYKSTDGGDSWVNMGLENSDHIGRVIVHPEDSDIVYVAAAGKLYRKNEERGIFKSEDGGATWDRKLFVSDSTAAIDVSMSPMAPDILFASTWERTRFPQGRVYGGKSSGLYRSIDAGENWELMTNGVPSNADSLGRIGVYVSPTDPQVVYSVFSKDPITNRFLGIFKSIDQGNSWTEISNGELESAFSGFGWFFGNVRVNPADPDDALVVGFLNYNFNGDFWDSWEGGYHVDQHAYEFHPLDSEFRVFGNDGGIYITEDGGENIRHVETIPNNQFYECKIHPISDSTYFGGAQDNGTLVTQNLGIDGYERVTGGDGFVIQFDQVNTSVLYTESQFGAINRVDDVSFSATGIRPDEAGSERRNWNTPFVTIPDQEGGIIYGAERVYYSSDFGDSWTAISDDLTDGEFGSMSTLDVSKVDQNIMIAGTDDGNVHITTDLGLKWTEISEDLPEVSVSSVVTDPLEESTVYVTFSGYRFNDYLPHVFRSVDYGATWTDISSNLPEVPVNEIVIDPILPNTYYLATDLGIFSTEDAGDSWEVMGEDLPPVIVNDLDLHVEKRELLAATFGYSMFTYPLPSQSLSTNDTQVNYFSISPNPVSDLLNINTEENIKIVKLEVININGQSLLNSNAGKSIDVSSLFVGNYLLRIVTERGIEIEKFVKM
ncbi:MAG TPA: hypothetical protein DGP89_07435 [Saprospirales bacterium]|nr:hypothetical protein [Saprospirales bacterium]